MHTILRRNSAVVFRSQTHPSLLDSTDQELLARYLAGNESAFTELYRRYKPRLMRFLTRKIGDASRAEELVQETFIRVNRHSASFDSSKKFSTWIYTIAYNLAKNDLRDYSRCPIRSFASLTKAVITRDDRPFEEIFADKKMGPEDVCHWSLIGDHINHLLSLLTPEHEQVFRLRHEEGRSYEEIAGIVSIPIGTVKSRLFRANESLVRLLRELQLN